MTARVADAIAQRSIELYQSGMHSPAVAALCGISSTTVSEILHRAGITPRPFHISHRKYRIDDTFFASIDTEAKAWALGYITADGNIASGRRNALSLRAARDDRDALLTIKECLKTDCPIHDREATVTLPQGGKKFARFSVLVITSKSIVDDLKRHGITPKKSLTATPWDGPVELMRHYWRGMVDGDGWFSCAAVPGKTAKRYTIGLCGSEAVVTAFWKFVTAQHVSLAVPRRDKTIWNVRFGGLCLTQAVARLLYGGSRFYLLRKKALADEILSVPVTTRRWVNMNADDICRCYDEVGVSAESLPRLYKEEGSWASVAARLGIQRGTLLSIRRRLGMSS